MIRIYETMFIVSPRLDEESRNSMAEKVRDYIVERVGGTIEKFYGITPEIFRWQTFRREDLEKAEKKALLKKGTSEEELPEGQTDANTVESPVVEGSEAVSEETVETVETEE